MKENRKTNCENLSEIGQSVQELWIFKVHDHCAHGHPCGRRNWRNLWRHGCTTLHSFCTPNCTFSYFSRKVTKMFVFRFSIACLCQYCMYFVRNHDAPLFWILHKSIFRQFYTQNEWRVVRHDVTVSVNFADRTDAHERSDHELWKFITLERIGRFCSNFHSLFFWFFFIHWRKENPRGWFPFKWDIVHNTSFLFFNQGYQLESVRKLFKRIFWN